MNDTVRMTKLKGSDFIKKDTPDYVADCIKKESVIRFYNCKKCGHLVFTQVNDEELDLPNYCEKCGNELFYE